ncbi:mechanosensitive ion channel family protein [Candidatus Peregrinibacteria bacterium]|nr:mechanosensitive ion channel family protein [Candidatus Peregrinibacteria bacterium]
MLTAYAAATNAAQDVTNQTSNQLSQLVESLIQKIPLWIAAFLVIVFSILAAKIVRRIVENKMAEKGIEQEHKEVQVLGGRISYVIIITVGFTVGLKIAGIDLTTIVAAVAFGIGFALKDIIVNFLAGIMILVSKNFTIGDFIVVGGTLGRVLEIQSRVTILQAIDGTKVVVPNAQLFNKQVVSYTSNPFRRLEIMTRVDYRSDLRNALKVCMVAVKKTKGVLAEPKPVVLVVNFGDSQVDIAVRIWVESRVGWKKIVSRLMINLKDAFDEHKIDFPRGIRQIVYDKEWEHGFDVDKKVEDKELDKEFESVKAANEGPAISSSQEISIDLDDGQVLKPIAEQQYDQTQ